MARDKKKKSFFLSVMQYVSVIPLLFKAMDGLFSLIKVEAYQAKKNIITLIILGLLLGIIAFSTWLCLLALLFIYFISIQFTLIESALILVLINLFLLILFGTKILFAKKIFFPQTKQLIKKL